MWGQSVVRALPSVLAPFGELADLASGARRLPAAVQAPRTADLLTIPWPDVPNRTVRWTVPVLLVHGYLGSPACWTPVVEQLHAAGFANIFALRYNTLTSSIPEIAAQLDHAAYEAMTRTGEVRVHLVGHSLGGLVTRYAVQCLGLAARADGVVTIATPHRGSAFAYAAIGAAGTQMRPGAELLATLPPLRTTDDVEWLVVDAAHDVVAPRVAHEGGRGAVVPSRSLIQKSEPTRRR
jgi:triacylglycerol lipase